jgi:dephospho-CoA kinase
MLIIGLTGGIGSGKSTVANLFADLDVPIIDMDQIARQVVEPGQPALQQIAQIFGNELIDAEGKLKRQQLSQIIFDSEEKRRQLEAILHPKIRKETERQLAQLEAPYCIVVIPLLLESDQRSLVNRILVVDAPEDIQIARIMQRDGISAKQAEKILASQVDRQSRLNAADDIINNSGEFEAMRHQVNKLDQAYRLHAEKHA